MTRLWQPAVRIQVQVVDGRPVRFIWAGRRFQMEQVAVRWRVRVWWRGIWREYYKLVTRSGSALVLVVIYHDLLRDVWYLQEVFD